MLRKDREVTDKTKIIEILDKSKTIRLGLNDKIYPYIVPVSFGYEFKDNNLEFYFHGANKGKKHQLISKNNKICVETDYTGEYKLTYNSATVEYGSIIAYGVVEEILEVREKVYAMEKLISHCNLHFEIDLDLLKVTRVYKVKVEDFTVKSNL